MRPDCPFGILYANIVARTDVDASDAVDLIVQAIQEEMGDQERRRRNNDSDASAFFSSSYVYLPLTVFIIIIHFIYSTYSCIPPYVRCCLVHRSMAA